jgi:hypothetical protein
MFVRCKHTVLLEAAHNASYVDAANVLNHLRLCNSIALAQPPTSGACRFM